MKYRAEIDGLRALAVLPVVLFHSGFSVFSGGYIGVDVFFVISGFVITRTLEEEIRNNSFSVAAFYQRRILRIYPALSAVLGATFLAGILIFAPEEQKPLSESVIATIVFCSNILFFHQQSYFASAADLKPLLHTWSLAVEEQFYIFFPLLLFSLAKTSTRLRAGVIAAFGLMSLGMSIWATMAAPSFNFYLPLTRAWELLIGSWIAMGVTPPLLANKSREWVALAGLLLVTLPVFVYDGSTPFPGLAALPPTVGAGLLIYAAQGTRVGALLSVRPLVFVGLTSYSLYLWHWPVIVFYRYVTLNDTSAGGVAIVVLAALTMAILSLILIEQPFRKRGRFARWQVFTCAGLVSSFFLLLGASGVLTDGFAWRQSRTSPTVAQANIEASAFQASQCLRRDQSLPSLANCTIGAADPSVAPTVALWGDSHAAQLVPVLDRLGKIMKFRAIQYTKAGCSPILVNGFVPADSARITCPAFNESVLSALKAAPNLRLLIIAARWDWYAENMVRASGSFTAADSRRLISNMLARQAREMNLRGVRVVVIDQVPLPPFDPVVCIRAATFHRWPSVQCDQYSSDTAMKTQRAVSNEILDGVGKVGSETTIVPVYDAFCNATRCATRDSRGLLYMDADHLSAAGANAVMQRLRLAISQ